MCTRTVDDLELEGMHEYSPESSGLAFCINNLLVVVAPFTVTKLIPPRGESKFISCDGINRALGLLNNNTRIIRARIRIPGAYKRQRKYRRINFAAYSVFYNVTCIHGVLKTDVCEVRLCNGGIEREKNTRNIIRAWIIVIRVE